MNDDATPGAQEIEISNLESQISNDEALARHSNVLRTILLLQLSQHFFNPF